MAAIVGSIDDRDWSQLSRAELVRHLEIEGYAIMADALSPEHVAELKECAAQWELTPRDYSPHQRGRSELQWDGGPITDLIAHRPTIDFLQELFGDAVRFIHYSYDRSDPGSPGISLHTDGQPYGSAIFGYEGSSPVTVRVLYYLNDLTPEVSPFRVVPRSHLSMHADANPYARYTAHQEQAVVTCKAGSALLLNHRAFHGTLPNTGSRERAMLAIAYRPAWAGPIQSVPAWDEGKLAHLPADVRELFGDPSERNFDFDVGNKPADMRANPVGLSPSRWGG